MEAVTILCRLSHLSITRTTLQHPQHFHHQSLYSDGISKTLTEYISTAYRKLSFNSDELRRKRRYVCVFVKERNTSIVTVFLIF